MGGPITWSRIHRYHHAHSDTNLDPVVYIKFNSGVELNSNLHRYEISNLLLSVKSDKRDEKIKQVIND